MSSPLLRTPWSKSEDDHPDLLLDREWLITNGLGGYASGTIAGACTRRYHGLLIAALPAPLGRMVMFNHLAEELEASIGSDNGNGNGGDSNLEATHPLPLARFWVESGLPGWDYEIGQTRIEKRVLMPYLQNTVLVTYRLLAGPKRVTLRLRPSFHFRPHEAPVCDHMTHPYRLVVLGDHYEIHEENMLPLRMHVTAPHSALVLEGGATQKVEYRIERARGYDAEGELWNPGYFRITLARGEVATLAVSTEEWDAITSLNADAILSAQIHRRQRLLAQAAPAARTGAAAELVLAADQFLIRPATRAADAAMAHAAGDEARTVIAGYHWFTDWGRDTMISLDGLTIVTGRYAEAGYLLRTFARYVRDGLIPNLFPEGQREGLYHTADATLWYFHALDRYVQATSDTETLHALLPTLKDIVAWHLRGTQFGIQVDPADGLLTQGAPGYQLTWMDAKVGDWVVTPRRGKAVEINALWYNALRLLEDWTREAGDETSADSLAQHADQARASFNRRFWYEEEHYLYDLVDAEGGGNDFALRPNQVFAISLAHPILDEEHWRAVVDRVEAELLTPYGLRSLSRSHSDYKANYDGDLRARDAAYHQGTVWAWLIGPFIDAWCKVYPNRSADALKLLSGFDDHLGEAGIGSISEVFDAEAPYHPRGCIAQAWSVAEVLRCWVKLTPSQDKTNGSF